MELVETKTEMFLNKKITAKKYSNKYITCEITANDYYINLGECNDGSKFTAINQAVNQAKEFITVTTNFKKNKL